MKGEHRWRKRGDSRYWDCVNRGCGLFCFDMKTPPRKRMVHRDVAKAMGECRGSWSPGDKARP